MAYPRMEKSEYPPLPKVINTEEEYDLVLEYLVFAAMKIEEVQEKEYDPLLDDDELIEEKAKDAQWIAIAMNRYDQLCLMIDDYKQRHPHFNYEQTIKKMKEVLK